MELETRQFGKIEVEVDKIITIPKGLPGFQEFKRYILLDHESIQPFHSLQCVDEEGLAFFIMDPFIFKKDYFVETKSYMKEMEWGEEDNDDIFIYVILNVTDNDPKKITANLLGPLLINTKKNQAIQMLVSDKNYSHQYYIFNNENNDIKRIKNE